MTTDDELLALRAAATPGPWRITGEDPELIDAPDGTLKMWVASAKRPDPQGYADAALIVAAVNNIERLIEEKREAEKIQPYRCEHPFEACDRPAFKPKTPDGLILCTRHWRELVETLIIQRDQTYAVAERNRVGWDLNAVKVVAALHIHRIASDVGATYCVGCYEGDGGGAVQWPCPTAIALGVTP